MSPWQSVASGLRALPAPGAQALSCTQAAWRFLANERVSLPALAAPLLAGACAASARCGESFALVVHDWSVLNYDTHGRKAGRVQVAKAKLQGDELATALLLSDRDGAPLGPLCQERRAADGWHRSRPGRPDPRQGGWRLDALATPLALLEGLPLGRPVVHLIDREADRVVHSRAWAQADHRFVVRADDRLVRVRDPGGVLQETSSAALVAAMDAGGGLASRHQGKACIRQVAQRRVFFTRAAHLERRQKDGQVKRTRVAGAPLELRLVVGRLCEPASGEVLAQWWLLTNVEEARADAATVVNWDGWRWQIESCFKLLKSAGLHLEEWGQRQPEALLKRLLVASMACVLVWQLARDQSPPAQAAAARLVRLSGRQTKRSKPVTEAALFAGLWSLLGVLNVLEDYSIDELRATTRFILGQLV